MRAAPDPGPAQEVQVVVGEAARAAAAAGHGMPAAPGGDDPIGPGLAIDEGAGAALDPEPGTAL